MKKLLIISSALLLPASLFASTANISPSSVAVKTGQSFSVNIVVDPQGTAYTAKIALNFPPQLLYVSSFTQASGWLPLSQPGYDMVDNSSGSLVKTAGATGGFSAPKVFGTVTFTAKADGVASITYSGNTQVLDANNSNTFSGGTGATVTITSPVIAPVQSVPTKQNPPRNILKSSTTTVASSTGATATDTASNEIEQTVQVAQAGQAPSSRNLFHIAIPVATFLLGFALGRKQWS